MTRPARLFARGSWTEASRIAGILRKETVGGVLLLVGTVVALAWANSPWSAAYAGLRDTVVGPASLHLDLTLGTWGADGLLAIFFFVAGLELKREFVTGDLRDPRRAALPVAAAAGGMAAPGGVYPPPHLDSGGGHGRSGGDLHAAQPRRRRAARLGDPDRNRHRLRPRRAGRDQHPPAQ